MINGPAVTRSLTQIIADNLPPYHLGKWFTEAFHLIFRVKPPFNDKKVMLEVIPALMIFDKETRSLLYRFQTRTNFQFDGKYSNEYTYGLIHYLFTVAIDEFNSELKKHSSSLAINRQFVKPAFDEVRQDIINAMELNGYERTGIKPHWKKSNEDFAGTDNDLLITQLPPVPKIKQFDAILTREQETLGKAYSGESLSESDLQVLEEAIAFYEECLPKLKGINLFALTDPQAEKLLHYLGRVFNLNTFVSHQAVFKLLFRVTVIDDSFLENDKVRDARFLKYPPLEIVKKRNVYNRCNSPGKTIFYASFFENVAVRETKPQAGQRIIISKWRNVSQKPFNAYPISLVSEVGNGKVEEATQAFEQFFEKKHPLVAKHSELLLSFWGSEFIKDPYIINPRRYEYLYSAFLTDHMLQPFPEGSTMENLDCILYPSVAWDHKHDNLAIVPDSVDKKLRLIEAKEYEVVETYYEDRLSLDAMPAKLQLIRESSGVYGSNIQWKDD